MRLRAACLVLGLAFGCNKSGGTGTGAPGPGTSTGGDAAAGGASGGAGGAGASCSNRPDLVAAAPACNTFANRATPVPFTVATGSPPPFTGGALRDGLYESTRAEGYGSATPAGRRISLVIQNGGAQWLWNGEVLDGGGTQVTRSFRANAAVTVAGNRVTFTNVTCLSAAPSPLPDALSYTVSGEQLVLALEGANAAVTTYTRRGCP